MTQFKTKFYKSLKLSSLNSCIVTGSDLVTKGEKTASWSVKKNLPPLIYKTCNYIYAHTYGP